MSSLLPDSIDPALAAPIFSSREGWFEDLLNRRVARSVPVRTLASVLDEYADGRAIDFLKIDVEGCEREVLVGNDWGRFRPSVVVVEATRPLSREETWSEWQYVLDEGDYRFAFFDGLNRYYVRGENEALLAHFNAPANVFDGFIRYEEARLQASLDEAEARCAALTALLAEPPTTDESR
jgi:hypothetical protein